MYRGQGRRFSEDQVLRIRQLLATTDLRFKDIAHRMGCTPSAIASINRRYGIRRYHTRDQWVVLHAESDQHRLVPGGDGPQASTAAAGGDEAFG